MCGLGVLLIVADRMLCGGCGERVCGGVGVNGGVRGREAMGFLSVIVCGDVVGGWCGVI